jgi:hypothetical protein
MLIFIPYLGKSTFLFYLLLRRLENRLPTAVQFDNEEYLIFDQNGPTLYPLSAAPMRLRACWGLADINDQVTKPCAAFGKYAQRVFQVTSPKPERWKEWSKQQGARVLILDLPTLPEIAAIV